MLNSYGEYQWFETNATLVYENNVPVSSQSMPRRRAQKTAIQQRNLNPVLDLEMSV